jgi:hypothetical protein
MISISGNKQLDIILPNTNKALKEVLKSATPQQLESITQGKDLKSVVDSLLQESTTNSKSDKALLILLKDNPTLKDLGNVSTTIKDLLNSIKSDKNPLPMEKVLKDSLIDMKQLSESSLKSKITNSGVFLESKLKNVQNPQLELKDTLKSLQVSVEKSSVYPVMSLGKDIKALVEGELLKNASNNALTQATPDDKKALNQVAKDVNKIIQTLQSNMKEGDITTTKEFKATLSKLEHQLQKANLTPENLKLSSLQDCIQQLSSQLAKSTLGESKTLLDALNKILGADKIIPQDVKSALEPLRATMNKADPLFSKETTQLLDKLTSLNSPEKLSANQNVKEIIKNDLKSILLQAKEEIAKSSQPNQAEILKNIDKLSLQIDYHQLVSHLSNSSSLYLPFSWDALEEGNLNLKKGEDDKFYCDIELKLKEYGELNLRLTLYDKNQLNIQISSDNSEFKEIIKENISSLRSALIGEEITPREIRITDATKKSVPSPYESSTKNINVGFEVKA